MTKDELLFAYDPSPVMRSDLAGSLDIFSKYINDAATVAQRAEETFARFSNHIGGLAMDFPSPLLPHSDHIHVTIRQ